MTEEIRRIILYGLCLAVLLGLWGCGSPSSASNDGIQQEQNEALGSLVYTDSMECKYAQNFSVDYYEGGYKLLSTMDGTRLLLVPKDQEIPKDLPKDVILLQQPMDNIYLVSSSVMNLIVGLDGLDAIRLSGQKAENWYIPEAREAMENGEILYAGKYSQPDYERIVAEDCHLAIENGMILHVPQVKEMLEDFHIPVLIEYSSYESHPLGRVEWIRFFGALLDKEEEAERLFWEQAKMLDEVTAEEETDKTVAFFYVTSNGLIQVRQSSDYIPKMIELAGGKYVFSNLGEEDSNRSTLNMQLEEFYSGAKDTDFLIYNSAIDGGVSSVAELLEKCPMLKDFKAVREGNVWCTSNDMYQQSLSIGYLIKDIHIMLQQTEQDEMVYLFHLE